MTMSGHLSEEIFFFQHKTVVEYIFISFSMGSACFGLPRNETHDARCWVSAPAVPLLGKLSTRV